MADLSTLFSGMRSAITWIYSLFSTFFEYITSNDLLLYPVLLCIVIAAVSLVIKIIRKFGMRARTR